MAQASAAFQSVLLGGLGVMLYKTYETKQALILIRKAAEEDPDVPEFKPKRFGESAVQTLKGIYTPSIWHLAVLSSAYLSFRSYKLVNMLLTRRYKDPVYQLLRPDMIKNKLHALKVLGCGLFVLPTTVFTYLYLTSSSSSSSRLSLIKDNSSNPFSGRLAISSIGPEGAIQNAETGKTIRDFISRLRDDNQPSSVWKI